jgi:hypothetical protein
VAWSPPRPTTNAAAGCRVSAANAARPCACRLQCHLAHGFVSDPLHLDGQYCRLRLSVALRASSSSISSISSILDNNKLSPILNKLRNAPDTLTYAEKKAVSKNISTWASNTVHGNFNLGLEWPGNCDPFQFNTGFLYIRNTPRAAALLALWTNVLDKTTLNPTADTRSHSTTY